MLQRVVCLKKYLKSVTNMEIVNEKVGFSTKKKQS